MNRPWHVQFSVVHNESTVCYWRSDIAIIAHPMYRPLFVDLVTGDTKDVVMGPNGECYDVSYPYAKV